MDLIEDVNADSMTVFALIEQGLFSLLILMTCSIILISSVFKSDLLYKSTLLILTNQFAYIEISSFSVF
jgi:hypothetical protein